MLYINTGHLSWNLTVVESFSGLWNHLEVGSIFVDQVDTLGLLAEIEYKMDPVKLQSVGNSYPININVTYSSTKQK